MGRDDRPLLRPDDLEPKELGRQPQIRWRRQRARRCLRKIRNGSQEHDAQRRRLLAESRRQDGEMPSPTNSFSRATIQRPASLHRRSRRADTARERTATWRSTKAMQVPTMRMLGLDGEGDQSQFLVAIKLDRGFKTEESICFLFTGYLLHDPRTTWLFGIWSSRLHWCSIIWLF
jgi:hypothetical protein